MFKVNNKDTRTTHSSASNVNFEHVIAGWVDTALVKLEDYLIFDK